MQVIISITGGIYPDRAAKQQTPVMQVIISITGGIYPDRAAEQQAPGCRLLLLFYLVGQGNIARPDVTVAVEWIVIVFVLG